MGLPCGHVDGLPRIATKRASTSSEITCSHRPASTWALCHGRPTTSTRKRSARRCLRTTLSARSRPFGREREPLAVALEVALRGQALDHLRHRLGAVAEALDEASLDDLHALLVQGVDRLEVLLERRVEAVGHSWGHFEDAYAPSSPVHVAAAARLSMQGSGA